MPDVAFEIVNVLPHPVWGAWEPLALFLLSAGAAAMLLAAGRLLGRSVRGKSLEAVRLLLLLSLACALAGQACLALGLEQPLRIHEFFWRPRFSSWTARGVYVIGFWTLCCVWLLWQAAKDAPGRLPAVAGLAAGCLVFLYATQEVMACVGRELWLSPLLPLVFVTAGFTAAFGLFALAAGPEYGERRARCLGTACFAGSLACAGLLAVVAAPEGFAARLGLAWRLPELTAALAATLCLPACFAPGRGFLRWLAGCAALGSAFMVFWKFIAMGQMFGRKAAVFSDAAALARIVAPGTLLELAGGAGLLLALFLLLSIVFSLLRTARTRSSGSRAVL